VFLGLTQPATLLQERTLRKESRQAFDQLLAGREKMIINDAIHELSAVIEAWRATDGPTVVWRGQVEAAISEGVIQAVGDLRDHLLSTDFAPEQWHTVLAADFFERLFAGWQSQWQLPAPIVHPAGSVEMWDAYEAMLTSTAARTFHKLEPIESLVKMKVSHRQIARMAGWMNADGSPNFLMVGQEIAKPGTHFHPDRWISPEDRKRESLLTDQWRKRCERVAKEIEAHEAAESAGEPGPEPLEELVILPGIGINQILKIQPTATIEQIEAAAERMGVRLQPSPTQSLGKPAGRLAKQKARREAAEEEDAEMQRIADADSHAEQDDLVLRLRALRDDGLRPGEIAKLLEQEGMEISAQKIGRLLAAQEDQAEALSDG